MALTTDERVHRFEGTTVELPYRFVGLDRIEDTETFGRPLLYFNGYGEGDKSTEAVLARCAESTDLSPTALKVDFSRFRDRGAFGSKIAALERVGRELVPSAMQEFSADNRGQSTPTIGHSMGSLMLGMGLETTNGQYTSDVVSVNGMGFTVDAETGQVYSNRTLFLARYAYALVTGSTPRNEELYWRASVDATKSILRDLIISRTFPAQLTLANTTDALPAYIDHAMRGNNVAMLSGNRDKLFNHKIVAKNVAATNTSPLLTFESLEDLPHQDAGLNKTSSAIVDAVKKYL